MPSFDEIARTHGTVHYLIDGELVTVQCEVDMGLDPPMPLVTRCFDRGTSQGASWMIKPLWWGRMGVVTEWGVYDLSVGRNGSIRPDKMFTDRPLAVPEMWCRHMEAARCS